MAALLTPQFSGAGAAILRAQFGAVVPAGVLGSVILLTTGGGTDGPGFLYNDVQVGDESKRFTFIITRQPTLGTLTTYPDGTFTYSGLPDTFEYQGFADGVSYGVATVAVGEQAAILTAGSDAIGYADAGGTLLADVAALAGGADALGYTDAGGAMLADMATLTGGADALGYADAGGLLSLAGIDLTGGADAIGYLDAGGSMTAELITLTGGADAIGYADMGAAVRLLTKTRAPASRTAIYRRA